MLRIAEHTDALHRFTAEVAGRPRAQSWEVVLSDPPQRASRYYRHEGSFRTAWPNAYGVLRRAKGLDLLPGVGGGRCGPRPWRPGWPSYLRYYSSRRPLDDHGAVPVVLVVFDDELAATYFLQLARREIERYGVEVPLWVSHRAALERMGPLERA